MRLCLYLCVFGFSMISCTENSVCIRLVYGFEQRNFYGEFVSLSNYLMHKRISIQLLYNMYFPVLYTCFLLGFCANNKHFLRITLSNANASFALCIRVFCAKQNRNVIFLDTFDDDVSDLQKKLIHAGLCANFEIDIPKIATKSNQFFVRAMEEFQRNYRIEFFINYI